MYRLLIFAFLSFSVLWAQPESWRVQVRVMNLYPQDALFQELYGHSQTGYGLEVSKLFNDRYEAWGNVERFSQKGQTSDFYTPTRYTNWNVSTGGKLLFPIVESSQFYVGLGANAAFLHIYNDSSFVQSSVYKTSLGGIAKAGFYLQPSLGFFLDVFTDYLYQPQRFEKTHQIGGFKAGLGLGVRF